MLLLLADLRRPDGDLGGRRLALLPWAGVGDQEEGWFSRMRSRNHGSRRHGDTAAPSRMLTSSGRPGRAEAPISVIVTGEAEAG